MSKQCRQIKTDGRKCGSPALQGEYYCYYHHPKHLRAAHAVKQRYFLELPLLEHRGAIRAAIAETLRALRDGEMDVKLGGSLLYALQLTISEKKGAAPVKQSSPRYLKIAPVPGLAKIYTTKRPTITSPADDVPSLQSLCPAPRALCPVPHVPSPWKQVPIAKPFISDTLRTDAASR